MNELLRRLLNLPEQASSYARSIDTLHYVVITITMLGATAVFLAAFVLVVRYRRRPGNDGPTPKVHAKLWFEALAIGGTLSLFLVCWHVGFRQYLTVRTPPADALEVVVTAKQWMWKFAYPAGPASAGVLYVPVGRPVKLLLTSRDVIHSFFVPAFRMKQDAVPGRYTLAWFDATRVGTFPILCAEFCGDQHSLMRADVVVLPADEFERWLSHPTAPPVAVTEGDSIRTGTWPPSATLGLAAHGRAKAAEHGCLYCHTTDGRRHVGPTWLGLYGRTEPLADGGDIHVDEAYLTESMMDPGARVVAGFSPVMPSYHGRIAPADVAAIVEFIKSLDPRTAPPPPPGPLPDESAKPPQEPR